MLADRGFAESLRRQLEGQGQWCQPSCSILFCAWVWLGRVGLAIDLRFTAVEEGVGGSHDLFLAHGTGNSIAMSVLSTADIK